VSFARVVLAAFVATACSPARAPAPAPAAPPPTDAAPADAAPAAVTSAVAADAASGSPSDEELERALAAANPKLEACRAVGLAENARLSGHVRVKIRVAPDGRVQTVDDQGSTLPSPTVACFEDALRALQLPRDAHPYEIAKSYTVLPPPDVWPTARDAGASR
jgi:membrane-bound lytic murein transglycosylase B